MAIEITYRTIIRIDIANSGTISVYNPGVNTITGVDFFLSWLLLPVVNGELTSELLD